MKADYNRDCDSWMVNNSGKGTIHHVARLVGKAYSSVSTPELTFNWFKCCGIQSYNPEVLGSEDFEASKVTEEDEPVEEQPEKGSDVVPIAVTSLEVSAIEPSIAIDIQINIYCYCR